jgi:L-seryl-tRNA(Ser) seleniumtransferase
MDARIKELLRRIPSMEILLSEAWIAPFEKQIGRQAVKNVFSDIIGELRKALLEGSQCSIDLERIRRTARERIEKAASKSLVRVVNATGVVIHTNLGRSCLCESAVNAVLECASSYSTLEFDCYPETGHRNDTVDGCSPS